MPDSSESNKIVLADFRDWSKPVNTLIEKCADAIGGSFRPYQITRIAEAEAKAEEIRALAEIKIDRIQRRAATRFIAEETKKQINMEAIIRGALPQVSDAADPKNMDDDWVANFFDNCRLFSDEQMQAIWSRILAGEANNPGQFSRRTVNLVATLDKGDLDLFSTLCRFVFVSSEKDRYPLIFELRDQIYQQNAVTFASTIHLADIGLISFHALGCEASAMKGNFSLQYFGQTIDLHFPEGHPRIVRLGFVTFTASGLELSRLPAVPSIPGLIEYVAEYWKKYGISVTGVNAASDAGGRVKS
jgi:hypothetical protein